ncbi:MAG TPA: coenzyme A pyrophosphatase, partial [Tyzzerella sp.]|nr:coenzyme A pyrophosphatase [Tyzzerella sp.]
EKIEGGKNYPFSKSKTTQLFYEYNGHIIWGFTAQVLRNIIEILNESKLKF